MTPRVLLALLGLCISASSQSKAQKLDGPDCSGGWPTKMAFTHMKNARFVSNHDLDATKTTTVRLASERIGKDLWHQVYLVTFTKTSGESLQAFAIHDASTEECSMTGVEVYVVAKHLNADGK